MATATLELPKEQKGFFGKFIDSISNLLPKKKIVEEYGTNGNFILEQMSSKERLEAIKDFSTKGGDVKDLSRKFIVDIDSKNNSVLRAKPIFFDKNVSLEELKFFNSKKALDFVDTKGNSIADVEARKVFENLNNSKIDKSNLEKVNFLVSAGVPMDRALKKNLANLQNIYPEIEQFKELDKSIKESYFGKENSAVSKEFLLKKECQSLFQGLNSNKLDEDNIEKMAYLLKSKAPLDSSFGKSILALEKEYPQNASLRELRGEVKKNYPDIVKEYNQDNEKAKEKSGEDYLKKFVDSLENKEAQKATTIDAVSNKKADVQTKNEDANSKADEVQEDTSEKQESKKSNVRKNR